MAAFIFIPAVMLALTPILVLLLRHVSLLTYFSLCFLLQIVPRFFFFNLIFGYWMGDALWLGRLIALSWEIIKQWRSRA